MSGCIDILETPLLQLILIRHKTICENHAYFKQLFCDTDREK